MAISLSRMQNLLGSNGRILMQMVLVFSVTLPFIGQTILLLDRVTEKVDHQMEWFLSSIAVVMSKIQKALMLHWQPTIRPLFYPIIEKMINVWEAPKVYLQWKMRALWDPIAEKMNNSSEALKIYLISDAVMGQPKVKLTAKLVLLFARFLLQDSELHLKYVMMIADYFVLICLWLLAFSMVCREKLKILCQRWACKANLLSNITWFILGLPFGIYCGNSLRILGVAFCMVILNLCFLVVFRPRTDFGFFNFIITVVGTITCNRFGLTFPTWIVASICCLILCLKSWLEKHWLDFEEDLPLQSIFNIGSAGIIFSLPQSILFLAWSSFPPGHQADNSVYLMKAMNNMLTLSAIKKRAPEDDHLLPHTRFSLRTQYVYYRFVISSFALDFFYLLAMYFANSGLRRVDLTMIVLTDGAIFGYRFMRYILVNKLILGI